jgi:hypothetical protein
MTDDLNTTFPRACFGERLTASCECMKLEKVHNMFLTTWCVSSGSVFYQIILRLFRVSNSWNCFISSLDEISKVLSVININLIFILFVVFDKQHFVDMKNALPTNIVESISNIANRFTFDVCHVKTNDSESIRSSWFIFCSSFWLLLLEQKIS